MCYIGMQPGYSTFFPPNKYLLFVFHLNYIAHYITLKGGNVSKVIYPGKAWGVTLGLSSHSIQLGLAPISLQPLRDK